MSMNWTTVDLLFFFVCMPCILFIVRKEDLSAWMSSEGGGTMQVSVNINDQRQRETCFNNNHASAQHSSSRMLPHVLHCFTRRRAKNESHPNTRCVGNRHVYLILKGNKTGDINYHKCRCAIKQGGRNRIDLEEDCWQRSRWLVDAFHVLSP